MIDAFLKPQSPRMAQRARAVSLNLIYIFFLFLFFQAPRLNPKGAKTKGEFGRFIFPNSYNPSRVKLNLL